MDSFHSFLKCRTWNYSCVTYKSTSMHSLQWLLSRCSSPFSNYMHYLPANWWIQLLHLFISSKHPNYLWKAYHLRGQHDPSYHMQEGKSRKQECIFFTYNLGVCTFWGHRETEGLPGQTGRLIFRCTGLIQDGFKWKWHKCISCPLVELALELHPVKRQHNQLCMQYLRGSAYYLFQRNLHQWSRRQWRKAESPSMTTRIPTVRTAQKENTPKRTMPPKYPDALRPIRRTMFHNTSDNSEKRKIFKDLEREKSK